MRADQLTRLEELRDRLLETAISDADPANWTAGSKKPSEMTKDERGDASWCRRMAIQSVSLTMQVQRLLANPTTGGAMVPDQPAATTSTEPDEEATIDAEIERYERAATAVIDRASGKKPSERGKKGR